MTNDYSQMIKDFSSFDIELTDKQLDQFDKYYQLLINFSFLNLKVFSILIFWKIVNTLLDSLNKRLNFLNEVIDQLGLNERGSIESLHGRAEDYCIAKEGSLRETFDIAVSRAVANMATLSEYCLPYVKVGGSFIAYKSEKAQEELKNAKGAIHLLGGKLVAAEEFLLPDSDVSRTICIVEKKENTSKKYPRKAGVPSKQPLQ